MKDEEKLKNFPSPTCLFVQIGHWRMKRRSQINYQDIYKKTIQCSSLNPERTLRR